MTFTGIFRVHFNRHGAAPLVWCVVPLDAARTPACELAVRSVTFRGVDVRTVYAPKATPDDEDGKPSAWMECAGKVTVFSDGHAEVTG